MKLYVTKRNTNKKEEYNPEKINKVLLWATKDLVGTSASDIAMNAQIQFFEGITTSQIHQVLIQSASDLISEKTPNYQYAAANLMTYFLRKEVFDAFEETMPNLYQVIYKNVKNGFYDTLLLEKYSKEEINEINEFIKHDRDHNFTIAGLTQTIEKYLVQNRKDKKVFETPQFMYICIAMAAMIDEKDERLKKIKSLYEDLSLFKISLPTPILAGLRTPQRQYSSCVLISCGDSLDSIASTGTAIIKYVARKAGIGVEVGKIRAIGSKVRNGDTSTTGMIPFLKKFQSDLHSCSQGNIRRGSASIYIPFWHKEIEDILVLKNNKGTDENRVRHLDYGIQLSKIFFKRFKEDGILSLFCPSEAPELYEAFGLDSFDELYEKYEADSNIPRKTVKAKDLMSSLVQERKDTGRIYIMNMDHVNSNSPFIDKIRQSNLCAEVILPTSPFEKIETLDEDGEIATCVLSAINLGKIKNLSDLEPLCENIVRMLDYIIENQEYPVPPALKMLKRRSLGVGVTNFAYWLAKQNLKYSDRESLIKVDELFEHIQFYLLKASNNLAKEKGACEYFNRTTYSQGILPIDRYNKNVDKLVQRDYSCDWEGLRKDIKAWGLRNSTMSALMPVESSSLVNNSTNGIEPMRSLITVKKNKDLVTKFVAPEIHKLKNQYELAFEMKDNYGYMSICAVIQKWIDQTISANNYYPYQSELPLSQLVQELFFAYQYGLKTLYYANSQKAKMEDDSQESHKQQDFEVQDTELMESGCEGGACAL